MSHPSSENIEEIAVRFRRGDHDAVHAIHQHCGQRLKAFIRVFVPTQELAEDLTQDVLVRAYIKRESLRDTSKLESWLFAMAKNAALREMSRKRHTSERLAEPDELARTAGADGGRKPDSMAQQGQTATVLQEALKSLDDKKRTMLALRYYSHMSHKEIAELMEIPIGSVGTTLKRALESMRDYLEDKGLEASDLIP